MEFNSLFSNNRENKKIEKLIIRKLREKYIPQFRQELGQNANPNQVEKLFQHFLTQIKSTGFMNKLIQEVNEMELNQKMSGLSLNNSKN